MGLGLRLDRVTADSLKFYFKGDDGKIYMATLPDNDRRWSNLATAFSNALNNKQDIFITDYSIEPGTVQINPASEFRVTTVDRGLAFVPKPLTYKIKRRNDED
jgi:hypothetical protein